MVTPPRSRNAQAGLTLVELMVTLVVASLVAASTFSFFAGQQRVYETQTKILNVQQNLWAAMETLTRHIRASGTGMIGCVRPDPDGLGPLLPDPGPSGAVPPQTGLRAFRAGTGAIRLAPLWIQNAAGPNGEDALTVVYGDGTSGNYTDAPLAQTIPAGSTTTPVRVGAGGSAAFRANEFMILLDNTANPASGNFDRGCSLFQITTVIPGVDQLDKASTSTWNPAVDVPAMAPYAYTNGSAGVRDFGQLVWARFFIDTTTPVPRLMMDRLDTAFGPQVLAEGVEDLQIAFACDLQPAAAPDGVFSEGTNPATRLLDEWTFNTPGDVAPVACNRPQAVRLTIVARTLTDDQTLTQMPNNRKPTVEDAPPAAATDLFRHRVITTTVYPRN